MVTRYDGSQQAEMAALMQAYLGRTLSPYRQDFTALIGQAGESGAWHLRGRLPRFQPRDLCARGRATFDETYAAFKRLLLGIWHRDQVSDRGGVVSRANEGQNSFEHAG